MNQFTITDNSSDTLLYAQPYDINASGFFFKDLQEYEQKSKQLRNCAGDPVEEFEIQLIDADGIDCELFKALAIHQGNFPHFFDICDSWDTEQKTRIIIAVGESGYSFDLASNHPDDIEIDIYELNSLRELAEQFVEEGLFDPIPERLVSYLDYDAIARDLGMDYTETSVNGTRYVYRCS